MDPTRTVTNSTENAVRTVHRRFRMILHQATRSGGFSIVAGRIAPCIARRCSARTSRAVNTSILFCSLPSGAMPSPLVNRDARGGLHGRFRAAVEDAFSRTVWNKNDVFWLQERVWGFTGKNPAEIH